MSHIRRGSKIYAAVLFLVLNLSILQKALFAESNQPLFTSYKNTMPPAPTDKTADSAENKKILIESPVDKPVILTLDNYLGPNTSVSATGRVTEDDRYIKVGAEKNKFFNGPYFAGIDVMGRHWDNTEFDLNGGGGDIYAGTRLSKATKLYANYRFNRFDVSNTDASSDVDFQRHKGANYVTTLSLNLERSAVDNELYPKSGSRLQLAAEYALKPLGGDFNFSKYTADGAVYYTPVWDITLVGRAEAGYMNTLGHSVDVPFFERYFVGSGSTVRGFKWGLAGPESANESPLGGDIFTVYNLEGRFPIYKKLKGAVFFDSGKAIDKLSEFWHTDMREGAGLGLRYLTPWVVIRADYGFILDKREDEKKGRLNLTLGLPF